MAQEVRLNRFLKINRPFFVNISAKKGYYYLVV